MRVVFAGTAPFAVPALAALIASGHELAAVLTQPDRPAGRGLAATPSAVKTCASEHGIEILQPPRLDAEDEQARLRAFAPEVMVVAAYGLILPQAILDIPRHGVLNIHASLLPRWRGAAPIQRALLAGDATTGISIMRMDAGLDTGPVLARETVPILEDDTAGTLHDKLAQLGARLIVAALEAVPHGTLVEAPQPSEGATYAQKIKKSEARIDWRNDARAIHRQIRAFDPVPGATTRLQGADVKIWRAGVAPGRRAAPGTVLAVDEDGIAVACGADALQLAVLQRAGGRRLPAAEFVRGFPIAPGDRFDGD